LPPIDLWDTTLSMLSFDRLTTAAIDVTSLFAAESFIERCLGSRNVDPEGRTCLATLIDLVINCDPIKLAIPLERVQEAGELFRLLKADFELIPGAGIALSDAVETRVVTAFVSFLKDRGWEWFEQWSAFQLTHPLVTNTHSDRLGGRAVSQEGLDLWPSVRREILDSLGWSQYLAGWAVSHRPAYNLAKLPAGELPASYTFDVFRRGWQYAETVRQDSGTAPYVPHPLRLRCLDGSATWDSVTFRQNTLWSCGNYVCAVLEDPALPSYRSPGAVIELVQRIRSAMRYRGEPTWDTVQVLGVAGIDLDHLETVHRWIVSVAEDAALPSLRRPQGPRGVVGESGLAMLESGIEKGLEAIGAAVPIFISLCRIAAGAIAPDLVASLATPIEERRRQLFKARLDFGPLLPAERRQRRRR